MILSRGKLFSVILILALVIQPSVLWATPNLQDKRSQAEQLSKEIAAVNDANEIAVEQYNQAQYKLDRTRQRLAQAKADLEKAEAELKTRQNTLNQRAAGIYKIGESIGLLKLIFSARTLGDFIDSIDSLQRVSKNDADLVHETKNYRLAVKQAGKKLIKEEKTQANLASVLKAKKTEIQNRLRDRQATLQKVKDEIARAESEQEKARLAAIVRVRPSVPVPSIPRSRVVDNADGNIGASAVRVAMAQLGKPYVWAAAGPNAFDCSGLTMYAYGAVGISLPHSAQAQYNMSRKISRDRLLPGDLVFGGSGGYISHVGIYIGNDLYVNAPQTGDVVKVQKLSARRNYVGAGRPY